MVKNQAISEEEKCSLTFEDDNLIQCFPSDLSVEERRSRCDLFWLEAAGAHQACGELKTDA